MKKWVLLLTLVAALAFSNGCSIITAPYHVAKGVVQGSVWIVKTSYQVTSGTAKVVYKIGQYTYEAVKAPIEWSLTHDGIETMDGLPVKEAIRQGRVKTAPYVVAGKKYVPMTVEKASHYREEGIASWYGNESGKMTANGEVFDPDGLTAAHRYLPIPMFVKVTNLENKKSLVVRVNDRGPFPSAQNAASGERIIDLSMGAAKKLGYFRNGLARVRVEAIAVKEE